MIQSCTLYTNNSTTRRLNIHFHSLIFNNTLLINTNRVVQNKLYIMSALSTSWFTYEKALCLMSTAKTNKLQMY